MAGVDRPDKPDMPDILRSVRRAIEPDMAAAGACGKPDRPDRQDTHILVCVRCPAAMSGSLDGPLKGDDEGVGDRRTIGVAISAMLSASARRR